MLRRSSRPILVGPFHGEVGYEALYWLPWLERLRAELAIDPARLIPVSRGGAGLWYGTPTAVELFAMRTPQQVRVENWLQHQQTGFMKQTTVSAFDRAVIQDAAQTLGLRHYLTLHPAWLYTLLAPFWSGHEGYQWLLDRTRYTTWPAPVLTGVTLPAHFVAVRFYFRATFPWGQQCVNFAKATIKHLARDHHVILLTAGGHIDDHLDFLPKDRTNVTVLSEVLPMTPENNLAVQSAVLAKADAFVGTYGGLAQLALRYGRPVVAFFDAWHSTALAHRQLSEQLALQQGIPFQVLRLGDLPLLQQVMPQARIERVVATEPAMAG